MRPLPAPAPKDLYTPDQLQGVVVLGMNDHDLLRELVRELPPMTIGFVPPIYIVETDLRVARRGAIELGLSDDDRFIGFFGPDAVSELIKHLRGRTRDIAMPARVLSDSTHDQRDLRLIASELQAIRDHQARENQAWKESIVERSAGRTASYWAERFASIQAGEPARVLLVTTRFSTYMQHAMRDLAQALARLGHESLPLVEPDTHAMLAPQRSLKAHLDFDPDIVVTINYPRSKRPELFPPTGVGVCWIQDAMAHLFEELPAKPSPLDFIVGFTYPGAAATRAYPAPRRLELPMPVSESKFHPDPVPDELRERYTCDIAYISHQSAPPQTLTRDFMNDNPQRIRPLLEKIDAWARDLVPRTRDEIVNVHEAMFCERFAEDLDALGTPEIGHRIWHQFASPLIERTIRHETLAWASAIAERHNLDMRLYGKGWEDHPTLARHARGELPHGEHLRACYQCAGVQLHASTQGVRHQRQYECAFSGGLMLSRRDWHEFVQRNWEDAYDYTRAHPETDACLIESRLPCYALRNHPELDRLAREREGIPPHPPLWAHPQPGGVFVVYPDDLIVEQWARRDDPQDHRPLRMLSDPHAMTFSNEQELEDRILRAREDEAWRRKHAERTRFNMLETVSMDTFAKRILRHLEAHFVQTPQVTTEGATA